MASGMNNHWLQGLSVLETNNRLVVLEEQFNYAVVATNVFPTNAKPTARNVRLAFLAEFENHATPTIISKFNCDFIIQFHTTQERDLVCSYGKLEGNGFRMQLVPWGNLHGGNLVDWETKVTIDVTGFPPHAFDPIALTPLLAPHCNIHTYGFNKAKGICRVDGYALSVDSVPDSGHLAIQFPTQRGVRNIVFPAKMKTYLYNQAPDLGVDESNLFADRSDVAEYKDEEAEYDSDVLREAKEAEIDEERQRHAIQAAANDTDSDYDSEGNLWRRDHDLCFTIESDRSGPYS